MPWFGDQTCHRRRDLRGEQKKGRSTAQSGPSRLIADSSPKVSTSVDDVSGVVGVLLGEVGSSSAGGDVGGAGGAICGNILSRSETSQALICASTSPKFIVATVDRKVRSVFLFFAAAVTLRSSILASCLPNSSAHLGLEVSSLVAALLAASAMHFSMADCSRSAAGAAAFAALAFLLPSVGRPSDAAGAGASGS